MHEIIKNIMDYDRFCVLRRKTTDILRQKQTKQATHIDLGLIVRLLSVHDFFLCKESREEPHIHGSFRK